MNLLQTPTNKTQTFTQPVQKGLASSLLWRDYRLGAARQCAPAAWPPFLGLPVFDGEVIGRRGRGGSMAEPEQGGNERLLLGGLA